MIGNVRHIIVIESLEKRDGIIFTGESLYNDVIKRRIELYKKDFKHKLHQVNTKVQFVELLTFYQVNSGYMSGGIVFHLEIHGDKDFKGLILSNGELIEWKEIVDLVRPINITACNKLFITMGVCNGRFLYKGVDPYKRSPYSGYISASTTVDSEEIYVNFSKLYEALIENGNIVHAYLEMEKMKTNFYYKDSERTFDEAFNTSLDELTKNIEFKNSILKDALKETKRETGAELSEIESEMIFKKVMVDLYDEQKKAFALLIVNNSNYINSVT
ncbi:MAG: hypothetical protein JXQ93_02070 [Flavobacteriaceae bacterium]